MEKQENNFKAGFVSLIGKPNAGKSTLMNQLIGERLSIITAKAQTTRHRIRGIVTEDNYQIVYSDTPGIIQPKYKLHEKMMESVVESLSDADIILWITDIHEKRDENEVQELLEKVRQRSDAPKVFLLVNKIDESEQNEVLEKVTQWNETFQPDEIVPISALHKFNIDALKELMLKYLPEHPAFFPEDSLTDRTERFFAAEMIREKIFLHYEKEVPYCTEVVVKEFKEFEEQIRIRADIFVERDSQKGIVIGKGGNKLKHVSVDSRKTLQKFFQKDVFLQLFVKVDPDWRSKSRKLSRYGYV
ncbi:MAG: GTPase Era [Bacteroidota bacterium]